MPTKPPRRRVFLRVGGLLFGLGLVALAILRPSRSLFFSDPLLGPNSPKLSIPLGKYGYTQEGLRRIQSDGGEDRPLGKTISGYLTAARFTAELSVRLAEDDIAYFGLGRAMNDPGYSNEPANCILFRIHSVGYNRITVAAIQMGVAKDRTRYLDERAIGAYLPGTKETFRIRREGDYVTLSIPGQHVRRTYSISQYNAQLGLTPLNTYLFFGNSAVGTVFSNLRVTSTVAAGDDASSDQR